MVLAVDLDRGAKSVTGAQGYSQLTWGKNAFPHGNGIQSKSLDILYVAGIECHQCSRGKCELDPEQYSIFNLV